MTRTTIALLTMALISYQTIANTTEKVTPQEAGFDQFYEEKEKGWYWYEQNQKPEEETVPEPSNQPTVIPPKTNQDVQHERPLSQKWFRENFEKYRDAAMNNPHDQEAMRTYLYLEKYMVDRAMAFGYERQKAIYSDPFLDSTTRRSTANFGMRSMNIDAANQRKDVLKRLSERSGIVFFFRSDDDYSAQQAPLLMNIGKHYGFSIKPVSIDGNNLPNSPWNDSEIGINQGQAEALGVQKIPAMFLYVAETNEFEMIAQGLQAQTQLEHRIMYAANRGSLISNNEFNTLKASGLYMDIEGNTGVIGVPQDAPEAFIHLYKASQGQ
ncbi:conjugal transfer protein TraF [Vibrio mediterranei]|uniref:conjugal transfer protein TraF n=1 Tax=Vibrio mediterranei TaxID=689 RepID=UPI0040696821